MTIAAVEVRSKQDMVALTRDKDARGNCYVVSDVLGTCVLCAQRLPAAAGWINEHVSPRDKVNVASLYESALHKRLVHRRFAVRKCDLSDAPRIFAQAQARMPSARAFVLTHSHHVTLV